MTVAFSLLMHFGVWRAWQGAGFKTELAKPSQRIEAALMTPKPKQPEPLVQPKPAPPKRKTETGDCRSEKTGPIWEALIATAIGIAAAIPAVLAYNFFLRRIKLCQAELEYFVTDFLNLAIMNVFKTNGDE